jgi:hypothetical protein
MLICCVVISYKFQKRKCKSTYLKSLSQNIFHKKLKNCPNWMDEQIKNDLKSCKKLNICPYTITKTFETIRKSLPNHKKDFIRFRIVNNNLYIFVSEDQNLQKKETVFEKALRTLTKMIPLPDLDIIYSDQDGTPFSDFSKNFYKTKNINLQAPLFSRAKLKKADFVILIPDYHSLSSDWKRDIKTLIKENKKLPWNKKLPKAFWRGNPNKPQRYNLCEISLKNPIFIDAGIIKNESYTPEKNHLLKEFTPMIAHLNYKYLPVLDGFMCSYNGYQWRLMSNSLVIKQQSEEIQWFYLALKPFIHYLPIKNDLSDLIEKIKWALNNDDKCKKISKNATQFIINNLSLEDVYVYLYKILFEYSKLQNFDKNELIQDIKKDSRWINIQNRKKANHCFYANNVF